MAWYVEHILKNKLQIESNSDLDSTLFSDLMVIKIAIKSLEISGVITKRDLSILELLTGNSTSVESSKALNLSRPTFSKRVVLLTDKIARKAGYDYTDTGFVERLGVNYKLTEEQVAAVKEYMSSKFKHKIMRKRYNVKKTI